MCTINLFNVYYDSNTFNAMKGKQNDSINSER